MMIVLKTNVRNIVTIIFRISLFSISVVIDRFYARHVNVVLNASRCLQSLPRNRTRVSFCLFVCLFVFFFTLTSFMRPVFIRDHFNG